MKYTKLRSIASILGVLIASAMPVWAVTVVPSDTETPDIVEVTDGSATSLTVTGSVVGSGKPNYVWWYKENQAAVAIQVFKLEKPGNFSGYATPTLKLSAASPSMSGLYFCQVTENLTGGGFETVNSATFTVKVNVRPVIKTQPNVAFNPANQGARVEIVAELQPSTTTEGLNYRWQQNGVYITPSLAADSTTLKYVIPAAADELTPGVQLSDAGTYKVEIESTKTGTKITSKTLVLKVNSSPVILKQPAAETGGILHIASGASGKLTVLAGGNAKLRYKWLKTGAPETVLSTSNSLTLKAAANVEGQYYVVVTNDFPVANSSTTSLTAEVVVLNKPTETSLITALYTVNAEPTVTTDFIGEANNEDLRELTLTATPSLDDTGTEANPLEFQWQKDGKNIYNQDSVLPGEPAFPGVTGAKTAVIKFSPLKWSHRGVYRCIIKNKVAILTTKTYKLDVRSQPVVITPPTEQLGILNKTATFSVVAGGTGPLTYQWKKDGDPVVKGGKAAKLTVSAVPANQGFYTCTVENQAGLGSVTTEPVALLVNKAVKISVQPKSVIVAGPAGFLDGDTIALSVTTVEGDGPITYQWQKNGKDLKDTDNARMLNSQTTEETVGTATLTIQNAQPEDAASYRCIVTNAKGIVKLTSATAKVTVLNRVQITESPASQLAYVFGNVTFSVVATGTGPLKYEWYFKEVGAEEFSPVKGGTAATLSLKNVQFETHQGDYLCKVYNSSFPSFKAESTVASLVVNAIPNAGVEDIVPRKGRSTDKIRVSGTHLNFVKEVWYGEKGVKGSVRAGMVYEPLSQTLLLTLPPNLVPDQAYPLHLISLDDAQTLTEGADAVTRVTYQANDRDNPTILVGSTFPPAIGATVLNSPNGIRPEAAYIWFVPKAGKYQVGVVGGAYQMKLAIATEAGTTTFSSAVNKPSILSEITFTAPTFIRLTISGLDVPNSKLNKYGTYRIQLPYAGALPPATAADSPPPSADWVMEGATAAVSESSSEETATVFTGSSSRGSEPTVLWKDTSAVVTAPDSVIRTEWNMSIDQAGTGTDGHFGWQVSGSDGTPFGQLRFGVADGKISTVNADGTATDLVPSLVPGSDHRFEITTDLRQDIWQARMDGVAIGAPIPVPEGASFGDVSVIWYPASVKSAKPAMTFDNVKITVE